MHKKILAAVVASVVAGQAMAITVVDDGTNKFTVGGHVGMRYDYQSGKNDSSDITGTGDSSRINFQFESKLNEATTAFARAEWGFDVTEHENFGFSNRLGFAGVRGDFGSVSVGQQWSTYSTVALWTDAFATAGGDASGMYGSWGHYNGTARANEALQYNLSIDGLNISAQWQAGGSSVTKAGATRTRDRAYSVAASYDLPMGLSVGGAYNQTKFVQSAQDDAKALVVGAKFDQGPIYAAFTYSTTRNHATINGSNNATYTMEKANGYELFASYQLNESFSVGGGFNSLRDKGSQAELTGNTKLEYYPVEVKYTTGPVQLSATYTFENSRRNGESVKDNVVAQVRYYF